jgi:hypothetical protein
MAFTRKNVAAAVAGTLSLAMLTGCPAQAPTGTSPSTPASAAPSAPTSAAPTTATSAAPSAQPSGTASGAPASVAPSVAVSAPPASGKTVIVGGTIYNEKDATVDGATVTVKSLDASVPYSATVQSVSGSYVVNNVPEGANVEVVVTKDGWTSRRRVQSFQQSATGQRNLLNFGGPEVSGDATGESYFISDYPEISATSPAHDQKSVDGTKLVYKVTLSEALDADSRDAFEKDFVIFPVNEAAGSLADSEKTDIEKNEKANTETGVIASNNVPSYDITDDFTYTLRLNNQFLNSTTNKMRASWNAAGTEVTFTFDGNLKTDDATSAEYQAALFNIAAENIEDASGNALGTDAGTFGLPDAKELIQDTFADPDLAGGSWSTTHKSAISFELKRDETDPKLKSVDTFESDDDLRIQLEFTEPMAAYAGNNKGSFGAGVFALTNYSFMLGEDSGDLDAEELDGIADIAGENTTSINDVAFNGTSSPAIPAATSEFVFDYTVPTAFATQTTLEKNTTASICIEVDPEAPTFVNIWVRDGAYLINDRRQIKARVAGVADPAGNAISGTDADKNLISASI